MILGVAVLLRLTLLPAAPTLSDDIYRYLWEGRLVLAAENPYQLPPSADELEHFRDTRHSRINHPELTTIYPPAAQLIFAVSQLLSPRPWSMKLLALLADLGLVLLLERLLLERGTDPANLVLYAWHPLPIIELSGSGHIDGIAIACMVAALLLLARRRRCWSILLLALSALTKLFTLALIPTWARRFGWPRVLSLTASLALVAYLPFARAGRGLVGTSMVYAETWRFNGSLFDLLELALGSGEGARIVACLGHHLWPLLSRPKGENRTYRTEVSSLSSPFRPFRVLSVCHDTQSAGRGDAISGAGEAAPGRGAADDYAGSGRGVLRM